MKFCLLVQFPFLRMDCRLLPRRASPVAAAALVDPADVFLTPDLMSRERIQPRRTPMLAGTCLSLRTERNRGEDSPLQSLVTRRYCSSTSGTLRDQEGFRRKPIFPWMKEDCPFQSVLDPNLGWKTTL